MKRENILLILWIIFGFIFIQAINELIHFFIHMIYFGLVELNVSYSYLTIIMPLVIVITYAATTFLLLKKLRTTSRKNGIYLEQFPIKTVVVLGLIGFLLPMATNKISAILSADIFDNESINNSEYFSFYGWFHMSLGVAQVIVMISLLIIFFAQLKKVQL